jgi:hypothetical protein
VECELPFYRGDFLQSIQLLKQRLADLRGYGMKAYLAETMYLLGKAQAAANQVKDAIGALEEGRTFARSMAARWMEWQILAALADLTKGDQALRWRAEASATAQHIAGNISDPKLRQSFLNRPDVQKLTEESQRTSQ